MGINKKRDAYLRKCLERKKMVFVALTETETLVLEKEIDKRETKPVSIIWVGKDRRMEHYPGAAVRDITILPSGGEFVVWYKATRF